MIESLSIAVHAFVSRVSMSFSVVIQQYKLICHTNHNEDFNAYINSHKISFPKFSIHNLIDKNSLHKN